LFALRVLRGKRNRHQVPGWTKMAWSLNRQLHNEKMKKNKHIKIALICILFIAVAGISIWFIIETNDPDTMMDLNEPQVPLGNPITKITAGDTVVVNVFTDKMEDVYGYQFNIHFDKDFIEYSNRLHSDIDEIPTIFATDKEWHLLVGATKTGDAKGFSGQEVPVCRVEFTAQTDFELNNDSSSDHIALSDVNIVTDELQYLENMEGWTAKISVQQNT
jgi:hypothetical protein